MMNSARLPGKTARHHCHQQAVYNGSTARRSNLGARRETALVDAATAGLGLAALDAGCVASRHRVALARHG